MLGIVGAQVAKNTLVEKGRNKVGVDGSGAGKVSNAASQGATVHLPGFLTPAVSSWAGRLKGGRCFTLS